MDLVVTYLAATRMVTFSQPAKLLRQFFIFTLVGLTATAIQYCILVAGVELLGLSAPLSSGLGFAVSSVANYLLNYCVTFRSSRAHGSAAPRFMVVALGGLLLTVALMQLFVEHLHVQYLLAQVLATVATLLWTFTGNACWTFVSTAERKRSAKCRERG